MPGCLLCKGLQHTTQAHTPVSRRQCTHKHTAPASHGGGPSTCPRNKLHSFSRDQWFQLVLSLLPSTIHTAPLTPCHPHLTPHSHMLPSHSSFTPCHTHTHTSFTHVTLTPSHSHLTPTCYHHTASFTPCHPHTHTSLPHYTLILTTISTKALSKMAPVVPRKPRMTMPNPPVIISMLPTRNCPLEMAPVVPRKPRMTDLPSLMPYKDMSLTLWGGPQAPTHRLPNLTITDN